MSLSSILSSAVSGLTASQAGLNAVSNNISNVNTPGYARQRVSLTTGVSGRSVSGVIVGQPERVADQSREATVFRRAGAAGKSDAASLYLDRIQSLLGAPGDTSALPGRLDAVASAAIAMTASSADDTYAASFTTSVEDALGALRQLSDDSAMIRNDVESEMSSAVEQVNALLRQIGDLNEAVVNNGGRGSSASGAADQRVVVVQQLAQLADIVVRQQPNGALNIDTMGGIALVDQSVRQISYPDMRVLFSDSNGQPAAATGQTLALDVVGGKLGALAEVRDRALPAFLDQLDTVGSTLAFQLNAASNALTRAPAPAILEGRPNGLTPSDRIGFTGKATFAVTDTSGRLIARTTVDFDALSPTASVSDVLNSVNTGLGGAATLSFSQGQMAFSATSAGQGVSIVQDASRPSDRAGVGFSQFFGMNDLVRSASSPLTPTGFVPSDPHGFAAGQSVRLELRDAQGRPVASQTITGTTGPSFADLVGEANGGSFSSFGQVGMDAQGRFAFSPKPGLSGFSLTVAYDDTDRFGTGQPFSVLAGLKGGARALDTLNVRPTFVGDPGKIPLATFNQSAALGQAAIAAGDRRGASLFGAQLDKPVGQAGGSTATAGRLVALLVSGASQEAKHAQSQKAAASARLTDAIQRRDSFSGVNIDEELSNMVVLQNSYSAAARVITAASDMYDTLLGMMR